MKALTLPPQLDNAPQQATGTVTVAQLNKLLATGHIDWFAAVTLCPASAREQLVVPAFMDRQRRKAS